MNLTRPQLQALGYVETSPGVWAKPDRRLAPLPAPLPEPAAGLALEPQPQGRQGRTDGMVPGDRRDADSRPTQGRGRVGGGGGVSRHPPARHGRPTVTLIVHRRQLLPDHDNLVGGCKHLRDAIAAWLDLDDADDCIQWEYHQISTSGPVGVAVTIALP